MTAEEDRTRMADVLGPAGWILDRQFKVLGGYAVGDVAGFFQVARADERTAPAQRLPDHRRARHALDQAADTRSDLLYKDVLRDQARVVWRGMIRVDPDAQKTDGYQMNQALLLSPQAEMDSKPQLQIYADDVKCSHGATVGARWVAPTGTNATGGASVSTFAQPESMHSSKSGVSRSPRRLAPPRLKVDAENALELTNKKFIYRFTKMCNSCD